MIDAGTIGATLSLDIEPFSAAVTQSIAVLDRFGIRGLASCDILSAIEGQAAKSGSGFFSTLNSAFSSAGSVVSGCMTAISSAVTTAGSTVKGQSVSMANSLTSNLKGAAAQAPSITAALGQGLINGLESKRAALAAKARSIALSVTAAMKKTLGIASPSKVMIEVGRYTAEGLATGMTENEPGVRTAAKRLASDTSETVKEYSDAAVYASPSEKRRTEEPDSSAVTERLDRLIELLCDDRREIELDGRTFASLVRRYGQEV